MGVTAAETAYRHGDPWLAAVRALLDENRRALTGLLADQLPAVRYRPPDATYLAWLDCREAGLGDDPAATFRARGVELSPGQQFGVEGAGHVRLNFATSPQILAATVRAMGSGVAG
jgi:cystathionine beta-lyase